MNTVTFTFSRKRWRITDIKSSRARTKKVKYGKKKKELIVTAPYIAHEYKVGRTCPRPHTIIDWTVA